MALPDPFESRRTIDTPLGRRTIWCLQGLGAEHLPYSLKVLLESCLRKLDGFVVSEEAVKALAAYDPAAAGQDEIPFMPGRVVLQDFTGVPAVVDLAAMRWAMQRMGGDPGCVNPLVPCDLVIDHSVQVDAFNSREALGINTAKEFERNGERYKLLKWAQQSFDNFRVVPPATGIVHQVNLEYLAKVVWDAGDALLPDSLVGTDSHTTMINGLGVLGWGVGGIEAEAVMLGQPIYMLVPEVVGVKIDGKLDPGSTATDLVLHVTEMLRQHGVVGKFVEFFGPGVAEMPVAHRATIANMAPEYGATVGFFPVDDQTLAYLRLTGRDEALVATVEHYCRHQGLWRDESLPTAYTEVLGLDLGAIEPSLAGPKRPQDRIALKRMKQQWQQDLTETFHRPAAGGVARPVELDGQQFDMTDGVVCIAAVTSCTNTSNPQVMIAAGLLARNARKLGLGRKPWVKTSLAPGSKVVSDYLERCGLMEDLNEVGFHLVGYGCTTCIGNSGPLPEPVRDALQQGDLVGCAVLSGNRNFEGRINPHIKANYLASPPLVVAYALAGTVDLDLEHDPLGQDPSGRNVYLKDIWPDPADVDRLISDTIGRDQFIDEYAQVFAGSDQWRSIRAKRSALYRWDPESTYIREPPFFIDLSAEPAPIAPITAARCLVKVGHSVTTDHISPAGAIQADSPAGQYLIDRGVAVADFNSYGSRRGNDQVMTRGTFANVRLRNELAGGTEGGYTRDWTTGKITSIYEAAQHYHQANIPLVVLAGKDYGMGSSRDWAAKGTLLLGVRAVIAESFERIHRSNLVGMGVLPLCYLDGANAASLGLDGSETFAIANDLKPRHEVQVVACRPDGRRITFKTLCRIDTPVEVAYYRNQGILPAVLRKMVQT